MKYILILILLLVTNLSYSQCPDSLNYKLNGNTKDITVYIIDINQNIIGSITCQTKGSGNTKHINCDSLELYEYFMFINEYGIHKDTCIYGYPIIKLPVELLYFKPVVKDGTVVLNWATGSETNNDYFKIERSLDGYNWETIHTINGQGNITTKTVYKLYDRVFGLSGIVYYRLSQTDYDGKREVFDIKSCFIHKRKVVKIVNTLGQEVDINYKGLKILIYDNGEQSKSY